MRSAQISLLLCVLLASACTPVEEPPPGDDAGLPFEPGGCGLEPYEWLPPTEVGDVVDAEFHVLSPLAREDVQALLDDNGLGALGPVDYGVELYTMRYGTQDKGERVEATGLVAVPWVTPEEGPQDFPVVLWLHGTTGFTGACAPSRLGGENLAIGLIAALGFIVVAPDYIGLDAALPEGEVPPVKHVYLGLEQTAVGSLDMVRATKALLADIPTGVRPADEVVLWGGSQGGHAAFSSDLLAPFYAPELDVVAMVALVPPTDLMEQARYALSSVNPASAALSAAMASMARWHGNEEALSEALTNEEPLFFAEQLPVVMDTTCDFSDYADAADSLDDVYQADFLASVDSIDQTTPWGCYFKRNSIVDTDIPRVRETPTLFQISQLDDLVDADTERASFGKLCGQGWRLHFLECEGAGHTQGALWSLEEQLAFVRGQLAGTYDEIPVCEVQAPVRCSGTP